MTEKHIPNQMTNSHILVNPFEYREAATVSEAVAVLYESGDRARVLAGGTNVLVALKMEREAPDLLLNISKIPGLDAIEPDGDGLRIGATATIRAIGTYPLVQTRYPALAEACLAFGSTQIQMMGTIGGNLCNGSPASDTVPALLALEARLLIAGPHGKRETALADFLLGPGKVDLRRGELLTAILLPPPPPGAVSLFAKVSRVAADLAKASVAIVLVRAGDRIAEARLACGSVAPTVIRLPRAEAALRGQPFTPELLAEAGRLAGEEISPIDDVRSTAWYRRRLINVMVQDALTLAWERSEAENQEPGIKNQESGIKNQELRVTQHATRNTQHPIELIINGRRERLNVAPHELLLNVLRERLQLTGTKYGCGVGECGACTVALDGRPVLACLTLALAVNGRSITTIEGLQRPDGTLHPLQQAFIDEAAFQCGYCTPGMIMTARCLLEELPQPTEAEIRDYLKGNRCRCTGYVSIVRAVLKAAGA